MSKRFFGQGGKGLTVFSLTVAEAARLLNVSAPRVYQLISQGALEAEKLGNMWLVSRVSVDARLKFGVHAGRPAKKRAGSRRQTYTLMNATHEILDFEYDAAEKEFFEADRIHDASRAPLGLVSPRGARVSAKALAYWWQHRAIPRTRGGMDAKLAKLGLESPDQIPFVSLGLSLSDQYWVRPQGAQVKWEDINFFDNDFSEDDFGGAWLDRVGLDSPDNTSEGQLPKAWVVRNGVRKLVKGGTGLNQEPYNEVAATRLYGRLLAESEYVLYELDRHGGEAVSVCATFVTRDEEYIPAYYVRQIMRQPNHRSDYQHYIECCAELGVADVEMALAKMLVCDDILGNTDRHWRNFGLVRNVETLEYRIAPLFDTGNSLWCGATLGQLRSHDFSFSTKPFYEDANRQLRLVNDYSWFDPTALEGFADDVACILSANPELEERIPYIREAVRHRIDRIVRML